MKESKEKGKEKGKILFFDPNNTTIDDNLTSIFGGKEIMKNPEDLTVSVDLEVINKSRKHIITGEGVKISNVVSGKKTNFLSGKELGKTNVLSTYFTDIKYNDSDEETLAEALSIKNIEIEFNSWYVATVTINFVDVRGASLFSPSEHNESNVNEYIKNSPYSAFFTMPYPQFNLKVKGIYGDAVSYPLHLLDFKSSFNNSTGNFEINTTFIGYTYAILNDIQMTYLIAAPHLDLYGAEYWDREVKNGRFLTLEKNPLPKIPDMIEKVVKGDYQLQKLTEEDQRVTNYNQTKNKINDVDIILTELDNYVNEIKKNVRIVSEGVSDYSFNFEVDNVNVNIFDYEKFSNYRHNIVGLIDDFNGKYVNESLFTSRYYTNKNEAEKDGRSYLNKMLMPTENKINVTALKDTLSNFKKIETENLVELHEDTSNIILESLIEIYGFKPSIYNFTKIMLAHMETLLHVIGQTAKVASSESRGNTDGKHETDLKGDNLDPFPWLTVDNKDAWLGDYSEYADYIEVKLVDAFHKAKTSSTSRINKLLTEGINRNEIDLEPNTKALIGDIWLPINAFDNSISINDPASMLNGKKAPYSNFRNSSKRVNLIDVKSVLSSRIATIASLASFGDKELRLYAFAESINILNQIGYSEDIVNIFITALSETIQRIDEILNRDENIYVQYSTKDIYSRILEFFYIEGFSFLHTKGQLPFNDKTISELKNSIEEGNNFSNDVTYYEENSDSNFEIIEGKNNCDAIYDKWYMTVNNLAINSKLKDMEKFPLSHFLHKNNIAESYSSNIHEHSISGKGSALPKEQPMLNRIGYVSENSKLFFKRILDDNKVKLPINNKRLFLDFYDIDEDYITQNIEEYLDNKKIILNNNNNIANTDRFTYPLVGGIIKNQNQKQYTSGYEKENNKIFTLFGHPLYYKQGDGRADTIGKDIANFAKAYLFLQTLPIDTSIIEHYIELKKSFMMRLPKVVLLFLGSVQWRRKYMHDNITNDKNSDKLLIDPILSNFEIGSEWDKFQNIKPRNNQTYRQNNVFTLNIDNKGKNEYDICDISLNSSSSTKLIKYFKDWCSDSKDNGWGEIKNMLEHKGEKNVLFDNLRQFNEYLKGLNLNEVLENDNSIYELEEHKITRRDRFFKDSGRTRYALESFKTLNIIYKDGSDAVKSILNLLSEESIVAHTGEHILFSSLSDDKIIIDSLLKNSLSIAKEIRIHLKDNNAYERSLEKNADSIGESTYDKNREINLQTYKYLKELYDKWVSGYVYDTEKSEYKWISTEKSMINNDETYDIKNFKFIDRSYNHIGQKYILNLKGILSDIGLNEQKTLYTAITSILSKNNFLFIAMPNYQPWNKASDFAKIFKPIPHHLSKIGSSNDMYNAQFLCMYTGELAKKLDNDNSDYKDGGLDLNIANNVTIPDDYNNSNTMKGQLESVPVFAVSYGKQNQQYFKNISLNQNNPATTEASVMAIQRLVERNDKTTSIELVTQDLYNIYSNYSYMCEVDMLGCAQIQPMMYFQLTNIPMWNGAYLIYKVKHSIQSGAMTTNFTGMKMGKNYPDFVTPKTITYGDLSNIYGGQDHTYTTIDIGENLGYFTLGDYFKRNFELPTRSEFPSYAVHNVKKYSSPIINIIYETWVNDEEKPKFSINSCYRSDSNTMHGKALAVDIQIVNESTKGELHNELFEHIKGLMSNRKGFKIDQLISESHLRIANGKSIRTYWVHVGVAKIEGNRISFRGEYATMKDHTNFEHLGYIDNAKGEDKYIPQSSSNRDDDLFEKFIAFWKQAENDNSTGNGVGWDKDKKEWYMYLDTDANKTPTIAYGLQIDDALSELSNKEELKSNQKGITDEQAIAEVTQRVKKAMKYNEKYMISNDTTEENWKKVEDVYKYILADIRLNVGNITSFPALRKAIVESTKDDNKELIKKECETSGANERNKLKKKFIDDYFA